MKLIAVKLKDIIKAGKWKKFCKEFGIDNYIIKNNIMKEKEEFIMTREEAKKLGLI